MKMQYPYKTSSKTRIQISNRMIHIKHLVNVYHKKQKCIKYLRKIFKEYRVSRPHGNKY